MIHEPAQIIMVVVHHEALIMVVDHTHIIQVVRMAVVELTEPEVLQDRVHMHLKGGHKVVIKYLTLLGVH